MNRYANLKPNAAQSIARAGSHSLWRFRVGMPAGIGGIDGLK
jgi:hypothetical protein